jgi:peptidoglycan hydrolase-like protein with peptidoglycan-binding domain
MVGGGARAWWVGAVACAAAGALAHAAAPAAFPVPPFAAELQQGSTDPTVYVLQGLLQRTAGGGALPATGYFGPETAAALRAYQSSVGLPATGALDATTAATMMGNTSLTEDGYVDDGRAPQELGYSYKILVPVYRNRSVETTASLIAANGSVLFQFTVRAHGVNYWDENSPWPNFNNSGWGLNEFSGDGDTPTGLSEADLNSPEDDPLEFGPYPINRMVQGLRGNAAFLVPLVRDGILMHTGEWANVSSWQPPQPMPNSNGCIHAWPQSIYTVWQTLIALGVQVRNNTNGQLPYPYKPQGLFSVFLLDP